MKMAVGAEQGCEWGQDIVDITYSGGEAEIEANSMVCNTHILQKNAAVVKWK